MLRAKITDAVNLCRLRQRPYFIGFLSEEEYFEALTVLKQLHFENYMFFGGFEGACRQCLGAFPDGQVSSSAVFPITALEFSSSSKFRALTHRDFLGAFMSCGVNRESIGDILIENGRAVAFVRSSVADYLKDQIRKVASVGVTVSDADIQRLPEPKKPEELIITVTSMRIDNIVSSLANLSRESASKAIAQGIVFLNGSQETSQSAKVGDGDRIVIRKKGKFVINSVVGESKKGKLRVSVNHFR